MPFTRTLTGLWRPDSSSRGGGAPSGALLAFWSQLQVWLSFTAVLLPSAVAHKDAVTQSIIQSLDFNMTSAKTLFI